MQVEFKDNNCHFKFSKREALTPEMILASIANAVEAYKANHDGEKPILHLQKRMHQVIRVGTFAQRVAYISLVGMQDAIWRQAEFRDAVECFEFSSQLSRVGIVNHFASDKQSRRIIAVHPHYVEYDEEIREGLKVMHYKHAADNPMFVCSEQALILALDTCQPGSTLVIDGHWEHGKSSLHGVWDPSDATTLARRIAELLNARPSKIAHVNLLGCHSGYVNPHLDGVISTEHLFFKYRCDKHKADREMATQRDRATYVSINQESVFAPDSLAHQLLDSLSDDSIAVTASAKMLFPWPPEDPRMNIGSDSEVWKDAKHCWQPSTDADDISASLGQVKSVTQISVRYEEDHTKAPWLNRRTRLVT